MQTTSTGNTTDPGTGVPPQDSQSNRDEDSGLHDIRSMASSAKMRISSKRITTSPPVDDDILASSSAGWKAVALPEPARMVSLPEIDSLSPVEEVKPSSERKSKKELKAERTSASKIAKEAISVETSAAISPAPVPVDKPELSTTPIIGARFAKPQKSKSKAGLYALLGTGIAAAAGVGWYVSTQMGGAKDGANQQVAAVSANESAAKAQAMPVTAPNAGSAAATVTPIEPAQAAAPEVSADTTVATGMAMATDAAEKPAADEGATAEKSKRGQAKGDAKKRNKDAEEKVTDKKAEPPKETPAPKDGKKENTGGGGEGEPSFDALLKEAGVQDKKPAKVALEKKSLSGADIKKGMGGVTAKAQACYAGTQGTATVKLTVNPDGTVQKVSVTGVFAGTPVAACVTSAVKSATFPPWDGGPQTFGYSYLLAE